MGKDKVAIPQIDGSDEYDLTKAHEIPTSEGTIGYRLPNPEELDQSQRMMHISLPESASKRARDLVAQQMRKEVDALTGKSAVAPVESRPTTDDILKLIERLRVDIQSLPEKVVEHFSEVWETNATVVETVSEDVIDTTSTYIVVVSYSDQNVTVRKSNGTNALIVFRSDQFDAMLSAMAMLAEDCANRMNGYDIPLRNAPTVAYVNPADRIFLPYEDHRLGFAVAGGPNGVVRMSHSSDPAVFPWLKIWAASLTDSTVTVPAASF